MSKSHWVTVLRCIASSLVILSLSIEYSVNGFTSCKQKGFNALTRSHARKLLVSKSSELSHDDYEKYSRHLILTEVGVEGQRKLKNAKVLCVGAGGLGSPALLYLAAAGIGTIGLIDGDVVDRSNLQRQIIHSEDFVGLPKVGKSLIPRQYSMTIRLCYR